MKREKKQWQPKISYIFEDNSEMTDEEFLKNPPTVPLGHSSYNYLNKATLKEA